MREIIFRGKQDDGEWICGGAVHQTDFYGDKVDRWYIIDGTETNDYDIGEPIRVIPETIGQYTGLTDKNGKKIFEGDIVRIVYIDDTIYLVEWNDDEAAFKVVNNDCARSFVLNLWGRDVEVIGNIHDNPELMEQINAK